MKNLPKNYYKLFIPGFLILFIFSTFSGFASSDTLLISVKDGAFGIVNRAIPTQNEKISPVMLQLEGKGKFELTASDIWGETISWKKEIELDGEIEVPFDGGMGYFKITAKSKRQEVASIDIGIVPPFHPGVRERSFFCSNTSHIRLGEELKLLQKIGMKVQRVHIASEGRGRTKRATILDTLKRYDGWILPIVGYYLDEKSAWAKQYNQHGPPADFSHFVCEWEKIITDFKEVKIWEFWNEPWIFGWSWADTPHRYRELQTLWANMALKVIPDAEIIVGNSWMFTMDHIKPYPDCWQNGLIHGTSHHPYVDNAALNWRSGAYQRSLDATFLLNESMGLPYTYITEGGSSVASPQFDHLDHSEFNSPNNMLNAAKIPELFTYNALSGVYQSNMQWAIGYGVDWTMSNTSFGIYTHFTEDRPILIDIWPENELITGAIFSNPKFVDEKVKSLPRADKINARWEVPIPESRKDDKTKVAILWSLTGKNNFDLDKQGEIIISNSNDIRAYDMMANPILPKNGQLVLPFGQYPVYVVTEKLSAFELYERIKPAKIEELTAVNLFAASLVKEASQKQQLRIRCKNQLNIPVSIDLKISLKGRKEKITKKCELPAGQLTDVFVQWPGVTQNPENKYPVSIEAEILDEDRKLNVLKHQQTLSVASFKHKTIEVDGDLTDWKDITPVTLEAVSEADESKYLLNPNLKKPESLKNETASAKLYTAYDEKYIYFCLENWGSETSIGGLSKEALVLWKKGEPDGLDHPAFCGDVFQIAFGFRNRIPQLGRQIDDPWAWKGHYYDTDYQYAIYKDIAGKDHVMRQWGPETDRRTAYQIDLVPYVKEPTGVKVVISENCYEIAIPRPEIEMFNENLEQFRFDFILNGKFQWAAATGVFDFWKSNGSYSPSWMTTKPCQNFWGIEKD